MDPRKNPYTPGAGSKPIVLAGREKELETTDILLSQVSSGKAPRSILFYGLRGVGKTVLLNEIKDLAVEAQYIVESFEISQSDNFKEIIIILVRKIILRISTIEKVKQKALRVFSILKAFQITFADHIEIKIDTDLIRGQADSGNFQNDLKDLFTNLGELAQEADSKVCILIDEIQYLPDDEFAALIATFHAITQNNFPIVFICAGLPQIVASAGDAKSYAERLFEFISLGSLNMVDSKIALIEPAKKEGIQIKSDVIHESYKSTAGYPYFIQEFGKHLWDVAEVNPIKLKDLKRAIPRFLKSLDDGFYKVRFDRTSETEKKFLKAMSIVGGKTKRMSEISKRMGKKSEQLSTIRAALILKGFIYSPRHNELEFTVPLFSDFIKRNYRKHVKRKTVKAKLKVKKTITAKKKNRKIIY